MILGKTMPLKIINISLLRYPESLNSAVYGLEEMFNLANSICSMQDINLSFVTSIINLDSVHLEVGSDSDVIILTPTNSADDYLNPNKALLHWLQKRYCCGTILASACCNTFVLAEAGLLKDKTCTTHWQLENTFRELYPEIKLSVQDTLRNEGEIITASGIMSWLDLGLEIIAQYTKVSVLRELGHLLTIDTTTQEQRFYRKFVPYVKHSDETVLELQQYLNLHYSEPFSISVLLSKVHFSERTLQRRFLNATGLTPLRYVQRLRIQKACNLLETTHQSFETIAYHVGYSDAGSLRKLFKEEMNLSPREFRERFAPVYGNQQH